MKSIMLIEDNESLANALATHLGKNDVKVVWAKDSDEAFTKLNSDINAILLDIYLPKPHNGLDILARLKADCDYKSIPVVMLTNINETSVEQKAKELGAVAYMVKSDSGLKEILEMVNKLLDMKAKDDLIITKTREPKR